MTIGILRLSEGKMAAGWVGVYYKYAYKKQNDVFHHYISRVLFDEKIL